MSKKLSSENRQQVSASTFTPGPWLWRVESEFIVEENKPYGAGLLIAEICRVPEEQRRANARLIAAAPELYEALLNLLPCAFDGPAYDTAITILAKARGEQAPKLQNLQRGASNGQE